MRKPIAATISEGGDWLPWPLDSKRPRAILHDDGAIWDEGQGWRDQSPEEIARSIKAVINIQYPHST